MCRTGVSVSTQNAGDCCCSENVLPRLASLFIGSCTKWQDRSASSDARHRDDMRLLQIYQKGNKKTKLLKEVCRAKPVL